MPAATLPTVIGTVLGSGIGGSKGVGMFKRQAQHQKDMLQLGNTLDMQNQRSMFDYRIQRGMDEGLTPFEMFLGPAGGAGGGTSGSGAVLGNTAMHQEMMKRDQQNNVINKQLAVDLLKTKMQTDAQKDVAGITAGASRYQTDVMSAIQAGTLKLNKDRYDNIDLPQAASKLNLTRAQTEKALNEMVTSSAEFQEHMKRLSMGVDNMVVEYVQNMYGFKVTDKQSIQALGKQKQKEILSLLIGLGSTLQKEVSGVQSLGSGAMEYLRNAPQLLGRPGPGFNK